MLSGNSMYIRMSGSRSHTAPLDQLQISVCCAMFQSDGIFNWDTKTQGNILGAFFYGYAATQLIVGIIAQKVGGKLMMLLGVSWTSVLNLLTPVLTTAGGFSAIFTIRLLEGIGEVGLSRNHYKTCSSVF